MTTTSSTSRHPERIPRKREESKDPVGFLGSVDFVRSQRELHGSSTGSLDCVPLRFTPLGMTAYGEGEGATVFVVRGCVPAGEALGNGVTTAVGCGEAVT